MHPHRQHTADRAPGWVGGLDLDPTDAAGVADGVDDPVVGQVEDRARSITPRARRLEHGSWTSSGVGVSATPLPAGPRALNVSGPASRSPAHTTSFTKNREEPSMPGLNQRLQHRAATCPTQ